LGKVEFSQLPELAQDIIALEEQYRILRRRNSKTSMEKLNRVATEKFGEGWRAKANNLARQHGYKIK